MIKHLKNFVLFRLVGRAVSWSWKHFRSGARSFFGTRILLKLTSLILAVLLWQAISSSDITSASLEMPLMLSPAVDAYISNLPSHIKVKIKGPVREIDRLAHSAPRVRATLDLRQHLRDQPDGILVIDMMRDVNYEMLPSSVEVHEVIPLNLRLRAERLIKTYVHVKPVVQGKPADGFELASQLKADPDEIAIQARASVASKLSRSKWVPTRPILLEGLKAVERWQTVHLDFGAIPGLGPQVAVRDLAPDTETVRVQIVILPSLSNRIIQKVPIMLLGAPNTRAFLRLGKPQVDVYIRAQSSTINQLRPGDIRAFIDLTKLNGKQAQKIVPEVVLPPGVSLSRELEAVECTPVPNKLEKKGVTNDSAGSQR